MRLTIDTESRMLTVNSAHLQREIPLFSRDAFELLSQQWLKVGWNQKYPYTFSWMGRPIIQLPEDMIRAQEVLYRVRPDVLVETGIAHGGSLIFYASLFKAMGHGRVIGVDIEIRPHNRRAIEAHELYSLITLIEGNSIDEEVVKQVRSFIRRNEKVMVILDSNHSKSHVLAELEAYHHLISAESYIVATDGSMRDLYDVPRGKLEWKLDNPCAAVEEFMKSHPDFVIEQPKWPFNESELGQNITHWPAAWLRRR